MANHRCNCAPDGYEADGAPAPTPEPTAQPSPVLDDDDPLGGDLTVIAEPGRRPISPIMPGDIVVAREPGMAQTTSVVMNPGQGGVATLNPLLPLAAAAALAPRRRPLPRQRVLQRRDGLMRSGHTVMRRRGGRESAEAYADLGELDWETPGTTAPDPIRWRAILSPFAAGRVSLRAGNAVRSLIDGRDTFAAMAADMGATSGAGDFIYLLGWDNFDDFRLAPAPVGTFREIYTAAAARGVEVAAMLWDQPRLSPDADRSAREVTARIAALPNGKAIEDDLTNGNTDASRQRLLAAAMAAIRDPFLAPIILALIQPDLARLGGSHHQKLLVIKRGETLVGYCGGIDLNPNRIRAVDPGSGQPHHDTHCRVIGPSAHDLLSTFLARWAHHPQSRCFAPLRGTCTAVPAPIARPSATDAPNGATVSCAVARTFNPVRSRPASCRPGAPSPCPPPPVVREREIKPILLAAIRNARRFIYCEDQYLTDLDTADALAAALPRLSHVTILIPGNAITDMPFVAEYRRDFVERVRSRSSVADFAKFGVFQLINPPLFPPWFGDHTYVHSKSWVFDDELAVIGTANCNRRSYTYDSEVDAFFFDDARPSGFAFAQRYRMDLWQHHLTAPASALSDGAASGALWRRARRLPTARVLEFDHTRPSSSGWSRAAMEQALRDFASGLLRDLIDPVP